MNFFFADPLSAMAPRIGAITATRSPAREFPNPSWAVLTLTSVPMLQYVLKKRGKNPAMTVVAKAELAQSYMAQPHTAFFFAFIVTSLPVCPARKVFPFTRNGLAHGREKKGAWFEVKKGGSLLRIAPMAGCLLNLLSRNCRTADRSHPRG